MCTSVKTVNVAIIGAGPAGLIAAQKISSVFPDVHVFDATPSPGRKFLLAGRGGLNLTHSEPEDLFLGRYGEQRSWLEPMIRTFGPEDVQRWAADLGIATFVGTSGRVFPVDFKAAPLMRSWLRQLRSQGVVIHTRCRWVGRASSGDWVFESPEGGVSVRARAVLLAMGGASWPRLGSDGAWVDILASAGLSIAPLRPANCGFERAWSDHFMARWEGEPLKAVALSFEGVTRKGEMIVSRSGVEGGLVYAFAAALRNALERDGYAVPCLDLLPDRGYEQVVRSLSSPRGRQSWSTFLKKAVGLGGVKAALLRECVDPSTLSRPDDLARFLKALPVSLSAPRPIAEAISSAGGVVRAELDSSLMLSSWPGVFCAGEMLDWEAPTGGYLLTACLATGAHAASGLVSWLQEQGRCKD
ncbi:TIGR03862 family flavoprotein [Haematospirillum sp. H1815]|uniref:TIGR03862 family flavoprotein n=1 Tax=Haematospirillum sp. H1815 TaxID=2723108 RepID=UPI00143A8EB3|nr:TIGR03862 family flavoprotein [Haematospirillum sp. H1815]NKD76229.1 TIGR03862 family flavoprotein [Haematospirillum sp. H1815]